MVSSNRGRKIKTQKILFGHTIANILNRSKIINVQKGVFLILSKFVLADASEENRKIKFQENLETQRHLAASLRNELITLKIDYRSVFNETFSKNGTCQVFISQHRFANLIGTGFK